MNPAHHDASVSTGQDAAYDRLVARYSAPDALAAALERVTAEARRRVAAQEDATQGRPSVSLVEQSPASTATARPAHRASGPVHPSRTRGFGGPAPADPYALLRAVTAAENDADASGPLVRPHATTGGRTRPRYQLAIEALVSTTANPQQLQGLLPEHQRICHLCRDIKSVAEISALLSIPLGVARILVAALAEAGLVAIHQPGGNEDNGAAPDTSFLERVLGGLRKL
ncbi:DUF742 domain-containing protein [Streptomyces sp. NPDC050534]|uniref:DUF742 domain-containing protein n=1 Tax=Streptomyces sp. NPDC050534 TaxID=3365625 RepID=UPI00379DBD05